MSDLDSLDLKSVSGVPMRAKRAPDRFDELAKLTAEVLAGQRALAQSLAAIQPKPAQARTTGMQFTKVDGKIVGGKVTNGDLSWDLSIARTDGRVSITASPTGDLNV